MRCNPLTPERWDDLEALFGPGGAFYGCWCMYWRLSGQEFEKLKAGGRKAALRELVHAGRVPGLLAYHDDIPAGWCSVAPRTEFPRLQRSPVAKPVDERPAWAVVCFFVKRRYRGAGVAEALLAAAVDHARAAGASLIEGCPVDPPSSPENAYVGVTPMFERVGFREVLRRRPRRPLMRLETRQQ